MVARLGLECAPSPTPNTYAYPIRLEKALDLLISPGKPQVWQVPVQRHTAPSDLLPALVDELGESLDWSGPMATSPRLAIVEPQPALDRLAIHREFACDPLGLLTALFSRHTLRHQIR